MKKNIAIGLMTAFVMVVGLGSSQAEVVLTDDLVFGIDSVIRDVDNGHEFLKLDFTTPYNYNEVVAECVAGGAFEGWRVTSDTEMDLLGVSANILSSSSDHQDIVARTEQIRDWFGAVRNSSTAIYTRGLISDFFYPTTYNGARAQYAYHIGISNIYDPVLVRFGGGGYGGLDHVVEEIYLIRDIEGPPVVEPPVVEPPVVEPPVEEPPVDGCDSLTGIGCGQGCIPTSAKEKGKKCYDGIDNDCDGSVDTIDPDCRKKEGKGKSCSDGLDNDGDQLIDCNDPGCSANRVCR